MALAFRAGGLIPLGRTNVPELALMGTTEPDAYGPTCNPWNLAHSPGGSSGGSAAAVAAGLVPAAHANDIAGSIRIPAAQCGIVGLKPSRGRVIIGRRADPAVGMNTEGVLTRTMRDTAALLDVITDRERRGPWPAPDLPGPLAAEVGRDPAVSESGSASKAFTGADVEEGCAAAATDAAHLLDGLGHDRRGQCACGAVRARPACRLPDAVHRQRRGGARRVVGTARPALGEADVEPMTWQMVEAGRSVSGAELLAVLDRQHEVCRTPPPGGAARIVTGSTSCSPRRPPSPVRRSVPTSRATSPAGPERSPASFNATGQPALSLPLGWPADGLPRGVQFVAAYGREDVLVRLGAQVEAAAPWSHRVPPISAVPGHQA